MARVFDGTVNVSFHQCFLVTDTGLGSEGSDPTDYYIGQTNGLCGVAISGLLYFMMGLHSGLVGFTVDVLEIYPPLDESWEEIVEVSFVQEDAEASLMHFYGPEAGTFPLAAGVYRVRFSTKNMDQAREVDTHTGQPIDLYSLIFWPAHATPDVILKQTSKEAECDHQEYGSLHS